MTTVKNETTEKSTSVSNDVPSASDDSSISSSYPVVTGGEGYFLRWSRIEKMVEVKESNSGLLRGSIAAPTGQSKASFAKSAGPVTKTILSKVSGCAAPGEVLAMMGPSGSVSVYIICRCLYSLHSAYFKILT
jgi:hypothetical protein